MPVPFPRVIALAAAVVALPVTARAQSQTADPQARPRLLNEGAAITDVVDASYSSSGSDPFYSFRVSAGFVRTMRRTMLQRERTSITGTDPGSISPHGTIEFDNVAQSMQITNTLFLGTELAIAPDFAFTFGVPVILSDSQEFTATHTANSARQLRDGYTREIPANGMNPGAPNDPTQLFTLPFRSPERSGVGELRFGLAWNVLNQARDPHLPTWLVRAEYRAPVGAVLRPCEGGASVRCPRLDAGRPSPDPSSTHVPFDSTVPYERELGPSEPGISRGVHGLFFQTVMSRRVGYVEPYAGLDVLFEVPAGGTQFRFTDAPFGQMATYPPIQGSLIAGAEIVPWENRESWQRFAIDVRARGQYISQGRDRSILFDALGSSNSVPLTAPTWAISDQPGNDPQRAVWFSGMTGVQSHARLTAMLNISIQAAKFLRFNFGSSVTYVTPHLLTSTDACNPNEEPRNASERGGCVSNAVPDPQHRPVIDAAGQRFRSSEDFVWDLWVNLALTPRF